MDVSIDFIMFLATFLSPQGRQNAPILSEMEIPLPFWATRAPPENHCVPQGVPKDVTAAPK